MMPIMPRRVVGHSDRRQSGLNRLTVTLLVLALAGTYGAVKFAPPYIRNYQLENAFDDEARRAHVVTDEEMRGYILAKAHDIGFDDWGPDMIGIERDTEAQTIAVWAEYEVPVELVGGKVVILHFAPEVDLPIRRE
ncbi:MAG TPA: hypothetical protein VF406_02540 [Thermodesulfobacteriota bacterium]